MSKHAERKTEKPKDKQFPWGTKTPTYKAWLVLFTFNILALSIIFVGAVEIPALQGENVFENIFDGTAKTDQLRSIENPNDPVIETPDNDKAALLFWCLLIIIGNSFIVITLKTVGAWLSSLEEMCWEQSCKWWCLCCNKWLCIFVTILRWVTWVVTIVTTIITTFLSYVCFQGWNPFNTLLTGG